MINKIALVLILLVALASCETPPMVSFSKEIHEGIWHRDSVVEVSFEVEDTVSQHHFYIDFRNEKTYPYQNIYLFSTLTFPNGKTAVDTVQCYLYDAQGVPFGDGFGSINDNRILYKKSAIFPLKGTYSMAFEQAMREEELEGVLNIGFRIEKQLKN